MRDDPDDAALREGARRFDAGAWFEAHEAWEEAWRGAEGGRRALLQGLILAAAALLQRERGAARGSARLWARGRARLGQAAEERGSGGLDLGAFAAAMDATLAGCAPPPRLGEILCGAAGSDDTAPGRGTRPDPTRGPDRMRSMSHPTTASPPPDGAAGLSDRGPLLVLAPGARAAEAWLVASVRAEVEAARRDVSRLALPVRIVVPSRTLRDHLAAALVREIGTHLGVQVQTLHGFACELLARAGAPAGFADDLYPILARREAAREADLHRVLGDLDDGAGAAIGAVSDFLDAGLGSVDALEDAIADAVRAGEASEAEAARAVALARVAERVRRALEARELGHRSRRLAAARDRLLDLAEAPPPARATCFHGFADATGLALDLVQAACDRVGAIVILDRPPDLASGRSAGATPAVPAARRDDGPARFTARVFEALAGRMPVIEADVAAPESPTSGTARLHLLSAPDPGSEVRAVGAAIRELLDAGVVPERIGVVGRRIEPYAFALRLHFGRLGIPFSSSAAGPPGPALRRARAFVDVVRSGPAAAVDRFLDAAEMSLALRADLRLACHALAAGRLADLAALDADEALGGEDSYPLPVRRGLHLREEEREDDGQDGPDVEGEAEADAATEVRVIATRRRVSGDALRALVGAARQLLDALPRADAPALLGEQVGALGAALDALVVSGPAPGSGHPTAPCVRLRPVLERIATELPPSERLSGDELALVLADRVEAALGEPLGGAGAGVRVLDAMAARGCTFEHLFVVGLARGSFPRVVREDPLLPDGLRRALRRRGVLESFPVKEQGFDEERWLLAELLSAAPRITLAWPRADEDGRERAPSPFVEEIRLALGADPTVESQSPYGPDGADAANRAPTAADPPAPASLRPFGPRTAHEHALRAGALGSRDAFAATLLVACSEAIREHGGGAISTPAEGIAAARLAAAAELDVVPGPGAPLGPFFGFVGAIVPGGADPRLVPLPVTTLERVAACPWQAFLERLLRLEPTPDALGALPALDGRLVGAVVHRVLEGVVRRAGAPVGASLDEVAASPGHALRWPAEAELEAMLAEAARAVLREEHVSLRGLEPALAALARPSVLLARDSDAAAAAPPAVLGAEVTGEAVVRDAEGRERRVPFRADRVERVGDALALTDYKTSRPFSDARTAATREKHHLAAVGTGRKLQATVYARAAERALGRYVHVGPEQREACAFEVGPDAAAFADAADGALRTVFAAVDAGAFLPRLEGTDGREPRACARCAVAEACLRGDSGARQRVVAWAAARRDEPLPGDAAAERTAAAVWWKLGGRR